jgi:hypothetical protein
LTGAITGSPALHYPVNFATPGVYTVWVRGYATNAAGDSLHVGLDGEVVDVTGFASGGWDWAGVTTGGMTATLSVESSGLYTVSLWMREDGLRVDRLLLTADAAQIPTDFGPAETARQSETAHLPPMPVACGVLLLVAAGIRAEQPSSNLASTGLQGWQLIRQVERRLPSLLIGRLGL